VKSDRKANLSEWIVSCIELEEGDVEKSPGFGYRKFQDLIRNEINCVKSSAATAIQAVWRRKLAVKAVALRRAKAVKPSKRPHSLMGEKSPPHRGPGSPTNPHRLDPLANGRPNTVSPTFHPGGSFFAISTSNAMRIYGNRNPYPSLFLKPVTSKHFSRKDHDMKLLRFVDRNRLSRNQVIFDNDDSAGEVNTSSVEYKEEENKNATDATSKDFESINMNFNPFIVVRKDSERRAMSAPGSNRPSAYTTEFKRQGSSLKAEKYKQDEEDRLKEAERMRLE